MVNKENKALFRPKSAKKVKKIGGRIQDSGTIESSQLTLHDVIRRFETRAVIGGQNLKEES